MVETLLVASLSCSDFQSLINRASKSLLEPAMVQEVVDVLKEQAPDHCVFGQDDEST